MPAASVTVAAAITGRTVPSVAFVLLSVIVYGPVPEPVTEPTVHPVLVPPTVTAEAVMPVTLFENDTEKTAEVPDSEVSVKDEAVGTTVSLVTVVDAADAAAGPVFVAVSCTPPAASCGCTVPSAQPVMVTVNVVPVAASEVNVQPVAVPAFEKSPAASPEMDSDIVSA